jgi:restriction system protein
MWGYGDSARLLTDDSVRSRKCIYCGTGMRRFPSAAFHQPEKKRSLLAQPSVCFECGWWSVFRVHQGDNPRTADHAESYSGSIGALKELDLSDISAPLSEVRNYLLARREAVFSSHPRLIEDVVGEIFRSMGWEVLVTPYSGDDGIDIFLSGAEDKLIGVQVRRYGEGRRIEAEQIRSLAGALQLAGSRTGVFVTTSTYRAGAKKTAARFSAIGTKIELIDGKRFFELLGIARRKDYPLSDEMLKAYVLADGVHLGVGLRKDFAKGEDLSDREAVVKIVLPDEIIDILQ